MSIRKGTTEVRYKKRTNTQYQNENNESNFTIDERCKKKKSNKKIVRKVEELQRENILLKESKNQERHIYKDEEDYL